MPVAVAQSTFLKSFVNWIQEIRIRIIPLQRDDDLKRACLRSENESTKKDAVEGPFFNFDGEVRPRTGKGDEEDGGLHQQNKITLLAPLVF